MKLDKNDNMVRSLISYLALMHMASKIYPNSEFLCWVKSNFQWLLLKAKAGNFTQKNRSPSEFFGSLTLKYIPSQGLSPLGRFLLRNNILYSVGRGFLQVDKNIECTSLSGLWFIYSISR